MKITIKNSKITVAGKTVLDNRGKNNIVLDSVIVTFVCPNGCDKGFIELEDNWKECKECAYIEQTN